jgi:hypothetical protein
MNCHIVAYRAYKAEHHCACQVPSFLTLAFQSFTLPFTACYTTPNSRTMADETDQTLHVASEAVVDVAKTTSGGESNVPAASSSSNAVVEKMATKTTPMLFDYWKKSTVTEADRSAYHITGWLAGGLESFIPEVDVSMIDNSIVFVLNLISLLGLAFPLANSSLLFSTSSGVNLST